MVFIKDILLNFYFLYTVSYLIFGVEKNKKIREPDVWLSAFIFVIKLTKHTVESVVNGPCSLEPSNQAL
jgi:hypothetical protein